MDSKKNDVIDGCVHHKKNFANAGILRVALARQKFRRRQKHSLLCSDIAVNCYSRLKDYKKYMLEQFKIKSSTQIFLKTLDMFA
jgi:hypothetical protein